MNGYEFWLEVLRWVERHWLILFVLCGPLLGLLDLIIHLIIHLLTGKEGGKGLTMRLLLVSCSATKRHDEGLLPARERYQGPVYRVISKNRPANLTVWILSAEFGLISEFTPIPDYNRRMRAARARELTDEVSQRLDEILRNADITALFLNLGKLYASTLTASVLLPLLREQGRLTEAHGGIGVRLQQTKHWLLTLAQHDVARPV